jgi:hypothetical protein
MRSTHYSPNLLHLIIICLRFCRLAPVDDKQRGQAFFSALKLRSEGLVPSSWVQSVPPNSNCCNSIARLFPPRHGGLVRDCCRSASRFSNKGNKVGCSARCACSTTASPPCWSIPHRPQGPYSPGRRTSSATVSAPNPRGLS